jgi:hypothetical protein
MGKSGRIPFNESQNFKAWLTVQEILDEHIAKQLA